VTPAGIEPATFRFVAQHLNHCVTAVPTLGKDPVPIVQEAGWAPGPVWTRAENLAPTGIRSPGRPARSQSLYRLSYPAYHVLVTWRKFLLATLTYLRYYTRGQPASIAFSLRVRQEHNTTHTSKCQWMVKVKCLTTDVLNIPQSVLISKFVSFEFEKFWLKVLIPITTEINKTEQHSNLRRWRISLDCGFRHKHKSHKIRCRTLVPWLYRLQEVFDTKVVW